MSSLWIVRQREIENTIELQGAKHNSIIGRLQTLWVSQVSVTKPLNRVLEAQNERNRYPTSLYFNHLNGIHPFCRASLALSAFTLRDTGPCAASTFACGALLEKMEYLNFCKDVASNIRWVSCRVPPSSTPRSDWPRLGVLLATNKQTYAIAA